MLQRNGQNLWSPNSGKEELGSTWKCLYHTVKLSLLKCISLKCLSLDTDLQSVPFKIVCLKDFFFLNNKGSAETQDNYWSPCLCFQLLRQLFFQQSPLITMAHREVLFTDVQHLIKNSTILEQIPAINSITVPSITQQTVKHWFQGSLGKCLEGTQVRHASGIVVMIDSVDQRKSI